MLLFSGLFMAYALRVNISVGIVAMVNNSTEVKYTVSLFITTNRFHPHITAIFPILAEFKLHLMDTVASATMSYNNNKS